MASEKKLTSFEIKSENGYAIVKLEGDLDADSSEIFAKQMTSLYDAPVHLIVDCEQVKDMTNHWFRSFFQIQKKLQTLQKKMRLFAVDPKISLLIQQEGLGSSVKSCASLKAALIDVGLESGIKALDVNFINPFLDATIEVLKIQTSTTAKAGKIYRRDAKEKLLGDISGIIGLASDAFTGSVVISFPAQTFLKIISRMLGEECLEINKDIQDGAGELTNIIFGQAKAVLNKKDFNIKMALPSIISGVNHSVLQSSAGPRVTVPFETDVGSFFIEICLSA